jgi:hypothetical protein
LTRLQGTLVSNPSVPLNDPSNPRTETELDWEEDRETLESILTNPGSIDSLFLYYSDLASRFGHLDLVTAAKYARQALDNSPANAITRSLWEMVIQTKTQLCLFEDAYLALMECPLLDLYSPSLPRHISR